MTPASTIKTVAVTGASGVVGREIVRALLDKGFVVRAMVRSRQKARETLPTDPRVSLVVGDISDNGLVDRLIEGADACLNLLGVLRESRGEPGAKPQTFQRIHVDATRLLVSRCVEKGVRRFVQMSALGVTDVGVSDYQKTKFEAEMIVRLSGLDWTIFRPSLIHGVDAHFIQIAKDWAGGHAAPYFFMPYFARQVADKRVPLGPVTLVDPLIAPVWIGDVARAFVLSLQNPSAIGEVYNLVGSETLSWPQMLRFIRDRVPGGNSQQPVSGIPSEVGAIAATAAGLLGLGGMLPFDAGMARMGAQDSVATLDKVRQDLGFEPAPFRASFAEYAATV